MTTRALTSQQADSPLICQGSDLPFYLGIQLTNNRALNT